MSDNQPRDLTDQVPLRIRRGRVDCVDIYEVKDSELDILEKGSSAGIQLNFGIFLLSLAFTSIGCLATATFKYEIVRTLFLIVAVIGILIGGYMLISWYRTRISISKVVKGIRNRIPTEILPPYPETTPKPVASAKDSVEPVD